MNNEITDRKQQSSGESRKRRGRFHRQDWAYILGLRVLHNLTYEAIGEMYGCTPSAAFYVIKQAMNEGLTPTLERPVCTGEDASQTFTRKARRDHVWAHDKVRDVTKPATQEELARLGLQDEARTQPPPTPAGASLPDDPLCRRIINAMATVLTEFQSFRNEPNPDGARRVKDSLREVNRSAAAIELNVEGLLSQSRKSPNQLLAEIA